MKRIMFILISFVITFNCNFLIGQCDSIVLRNQREINQFISNYGKCSVVNYLIINDEDADITHLDSLFSIERINDELKLNFSINNQNIKNISGLRNLMYVNLFTLNTNKVDGKLISLNIVEELIFSNNGEPNSEIFSLFPYLDTIKSRLLISNNITEKNTPNFKTGEDFTLWLAGAIDSTSLQVLSRKISKSNLKTLFIFPSDGIDLRHLTILDSVKNIQLSYCKNGNFTNFETARNLMSLTIENDLGNNNFGNGFLHVQNLDIIWLSNNKFRLDMNRMFPNILSLNDRLFISNQDSLTNLHFLDNVSAPQEPANFFTILISNNIRLAECNSSFLCEAISRYPESVIIQNNGSKCSKEEIIKYCKTVNTLEIEKLKLVISPNPTNGNLKIDNLTSPATVIITNINGQILKILQNVQNAVDISELPAGMYIFDIRNKEISERHKIVKVE